MPFSFTKDKKETGLGGVGYPYPNTQIKLKKKKVGIIIAPTWQTKGNEWSIRFAVKKEITKEDPCDFYWITILRKFDSEVEAREFIRENEKDIRNYDLYMFED